MLKKIYKLKKEKDFSWTFRRSKPVFTSHLSLRAARSSFSNTRFGFIISAKVEKSAVRRNALKRILNDRAKEKLPLIQGNFNIIVVVKGKFEYPYDPAKVQSQLDQLLLKAGLVKQS